MLVFSSTKASARLSARINHVCTCVYHNQDLRTFEPKLRTQQSQDKFAQIPTGPIGSESLANSKLHYASSLVKVVHQRRGWGTWDGDLCLMCNQGYVITTVIDNRAKKLLQRLIYFIGAAVAEIRYGYWPLGKDLWKYGI